ncbi:hypothetical protein ACIBF1_10240 [Spirillospora sp. NPDC050679]
MNDLDVSARAHLTEKNIRKIGLRDPEPMGESRRHTERDHTEGAGQCDAITECTQAAAAPVSPGVVS